MTTVEMIHGVENPTTFKMTFQNAYIMRQDDNSHLLLNICIFEKTIYLFP